MIVVVDTRYVLYRSNFKMSHLSFNNVSTGAMFGLTKTLKSFRNYYGEDTKFLLTHDSGIPQFRKDLSDDNYKSGRSIDEETIKSVNKQQATIQYYLPLPQWVELQAEADDLIASFCINHNVEKEDVCIITNDKDIYSSLRDGVYIQKSINERPFTVDDLFFEYNEATSETWPLIKAIAGDKSDNLAGIPGFREAKASKLIQQGKVAELLCNEEYREIVEKNLKIVTPITSYKNWPEPQPINITKWNMFCSKYGMIQSRIDQDLKTLFNKPKNQPVTNSNKLDLFCPSIVKNFMK